MPNNIPIITATPAPYTDNFRTPSEQKAYNERKKIFKKQMDKQNAAKKKEQKKIKNNQNKPSYIKNHGYSNISRPTLRDDALINRDQGKIILLSKDINKNHHSPLANQAIAIQKLIDDRLGSADNFKPLGQISPRDLEEANLLKAEQRKLLCTVSQQKLDEINKEYGDDYTEYEDVVETVKFHKKYLQDNQQTYDDIFTCMVALPISCPNNSSSNDSSESSATVYAQIDNNNSSSGGYESFQQINDNSLEPFQECSPGTTSKWKENSIYSSFEECSPGTTSKWKENSIYSSSDLDSHNNKNFDPLKSDSPKKPFGNGPAPIPVKRDYPKKPFGNGPAPIPVKRDYPKKPFGNGPAPIPVKRDYPK